MKTQVFRSALQARLAEIQTKNPRFSIRAFARQLGIQSGTLSLVLLGKRPVSRRLGLKLATGLGWDPQKKEEILSTLKRTRSPNTALNLRALELKADQYLFLKDWRHPALLSLMRLKDFTPDEEWMAKCLQTPLKEIKSAWNRLIRLGFVQLSKNGDCSLNVDRVKTKDDEANSALRFSHSQGLEQARDALTEVPLSQREYNWMVFAIANEDMPQIKEKIRKFREDILSEFGRASGADQVVRLNLQLFPYTKTETHNENL